MRKRLAKLDFIASPAPVLLRNFLAAPAHIAPAVRLPVWATVPAMPGTIALPPLRRRLRFHVLQAATALPAAAPPSRARLAPTARLRLSATICGARRERTADRLD